MLCEEKWVSVVSDERGPAVLGELNQCCIINSSSVNQSSLPFGPGGRGGSLYCQFQNYFCLFVICIACARAWCSHIISPVNIWAKSG